MQRKQIIDCLVYVIVRILICIVQAMRIETGHAVGRWLAWLFADVIHLRGRVVDENLMHAFPDLSADDRQRLARQMWEHLFLLVLEVAHTPRKIHETNWRRFVRLTNSAPMLRLMIGERPVIVVTGHFGNFELGGYMLGVLGFPTHTVARNLDNAHLDRFIERFRGATGQHIIPKNGGYDQILDVLKQGGTMALLADQYAGEKGCWVEFFGRPASAHKAIALLAMEHDAPIAVCYARRLGGPMQFEMVTRGIMDPRSANDDVSSVSALTQWYTRQLEEAIRNDPGQYWWLHRRWKDPRKKKAAEQKKAA